MLTWMKAIAVLAISAIIAPFAAAQTTVVQWNFNSTTPDATVSTGTLSPSVDNAVGLPVVQPVGGIGPSGFGFFVAADSGRVGGASSDPADNTDDSALAGQSFPAQGTASGTAGFAWSVDTTGYTDLIVRYDQRSLNTTSRHWQFQYSVDGVTFLPWGTYATINGTAPLDPATISYWNTFEWDMSGIAELNDNPLAAFRVVAVFAPGQSVYTAAGPMQSYSQNGQLRLDYITVSGTPLTPAFVEGDADSDGDVDFDDLGILLGNYDLAGLPAFTGGDSDGDGDVDFDDLGLLLGNYGFGVLPAALDSASIDVAHARIEAAGITAAVPEPSSAACVVCLAGVLVSRRLRLA